MSDVWYKIKWYWSCWVFGHRVIPGDTSCLYCDKEMTND